MPLWGWICIGLMGLAVASVVLFYIFAMHLPYQRESKSLEQYGVDVVGRVLCANTSVYEVMDPPSFEFAIVVFTRDNDASEQHLAFLGEIIQRLQDFVPDESDPVESKLAWSLSTQRTVGDVLPIPDRVTGGRKVYYSSVGVTRRMLPEGKLTRDYIHIRTAIESPVRCSRMIEYPA